MSQVLAVPATLPVTRPGRTASPGRVRPAPTCAAAGPGPVRGISDGCRGAKRSRRVRWGSPAGMVSAGLTRAIGGEVMRLRFTIRGLLLVVLIAGLMLVSWQWGYRTASLRTGAARTMTTPVVTMTKHRVGARLWKQLTVTPGPCRVTVQGQVELLDQANKSYWWGLVVTDMLTGRVVLDVNYRDRAFTVPRGEEQQPTLQDTRPLLPGDYMVELILHEVGGQPSKQEMSAWEYVAIGP